MKEVVVIGAGFAGLAAARCLTDHGGQDIRVKILEGGNRVGGRACTCSLPGLGSVEFGATYLHGTVGHHVNQTATDAGLLGPVHTKDFFWNFIEPGQADALHIKDFELVQQALQAFARARDEDESHGLTLGEKLSHSKKKELQKLPASVHQLFLRAWRWHEVQLMLNTSAPSSAEVSSAWWEVCEDLEGPNFPIPGGFQRVAEHLAKGLDVCFCATVTKIEYGGHGVTITASNGQVYKADAAICTVSLGVLKESHQTLFTPALPPAKAAAIERLGYGYNEKLFVEFNGGSEAQIDQVPSVAYQLLWDLEWPGPGKQEILANAIDGHRLPAWVYGIFSFRFGGSEFKPATVPAKTAADSSASQQKYSGDPSQYYGNSSIEMAHVAAHFPPSEAKAMPKAACHPKAACVWVSGWHANALSHASDDEVRQGLGQVLDAFPAIPFASSDITRIWQSSWSSNPLFRGAYSFVAANSHPDDIEQLASAVTDESGLLRLLFAGEATTATNTSSTHGAYATGIREANRLLKAWQIGNISNGH